MDRINTIAALVLIIAAGLVATTLFVPNFRQAGRAVAAHAETQPELRGSEIRIERSGIWQHYDIQY